MVYLAIPGLLEQKTTIRFADQPRCTETDSVRRRGSDYDAICKGADCGIAVDLILRLHFAMFLSSSADLRLLALPALSSSANGAMSPSWVEETVVKAWTKAAVPLSTADHQCTSVRHSLHQWQGEARTPIKPQPIMTSTSSRQPNLTARKDRTMRDAVQYRNKQSGHQYSQLLRRLPCK